MAAGPHLCTDAPSRLDPVEAVFAQAADAHHGRPLEALHVALLRLAAPGPVGWSRSDPADPALLPQTVRDAEATRAGIAALVASAVISGELEAGTDVDALARAVHVAQQGSVAVWATVGRGPFATALRHDVDAVLAAHRRPGR